MNNNVLIVELKLLERGNLKAFADVTLPTEQGEITLRGFRVIQKDGQAPWVGFPTSSYTNKDGKTVSNPVLELSRGLKRQVTDLVIAEFKKAKERQ